MSGTFDALQVFEPNQRSGFFLNFLSKATSAAKLAAFGVVAVPVTADWGPAGLCDPILASNLEGGLKSVFSDSTGGTAHFAVREILKNARAVLPYRAVGTAVAGVVTVANIGVFTAIYKGIYGNGKIVISANPVSGKDVAVYDKLNVLLVTYTGILTNDALAAAIANSGYCTLVVETGKNATVPAEGTYTLISGTTDLTVTSGMITTALAVLETVTSAWDVFTTDVDDTAIQDAIVVWLKRIRTEGSYVQAVLGAASGLSVSASIARAAAMNTEGVIYNFSGWTPTGEVSARTAATCAAQLAGIVAGKGANGSVTYAEVTGIETLASPLTNTQVKQLNAGGVVCVFNDGETYRIEKGINTLTTYTAIQNKRWSKIRVIRTFDAIAKGLSSAGNKIYVGKLDNDADGQKTFIAAVLTFLGACYDAHLIKKGYNAYADPDFADSNADGDGFFYKFEIAVVDSMDKMFGTVIAS